MTLKTHDEIPNTWYSGDLLTFLYDNSTYDPVTDPVNYEFTQEGTGTRFAVGGTDNGDGRYLFELDDLITGRWYWRVFLLVGADSLTLGTGVLTVKPVPAVGIDPRSHYQIVLDNINAVLENRATKDQLSYSFQGRSLQKTPLGELRDFQSTYEKLVANERATENANAQVSSTIKAQF